MRYIKYKLQLHELRLLYVSEDLVAIINIIINVDILD